MPKGPEPRKPNFRAISLRECRPLVIEHHYSRRLPASVTLCYGDIDYTPTRKVWACCLFSTATGRWQDSLWELTRLVRLPTYKIPLTKLIGKAIGHIRQGKLTNLVVSFADLEEDHHGGIYQACSWIYDGMRNQRIDGFNIDGLFVPARTCNQRYGTSSVDSLQWKLSGQTVEPHFDSGKHCYWKPLSKGGMQKALSLELRSDRYPKPLIQSASMERFTEATNLKVAPPLRKGVVQLPIKRHPSPKPSALDGGTDLV